MNTKNQTEELKEIIKQQSIVISSVVILLFRIVYNNDGVNFLKTIDSEQMGDLLKEARALTKKTQSVFREENSEHE